MQPHRLWGWFGVITACDHGAGAWAHARHLHQGYQLFARIVNFGVDQRDVELVLGGQLLARGPQPALPLLLRLGPPAHEPAHQLLPGRRLEEDEQRVGHALPHLSGPLEVDLQQRQPPGGERLLDGPARRAVAGGPVHHRPLEQVALGDHQVELRVGEEPVVPAVHLPRPCGTSGDRHRDPDLGVVRAQVGRDGALADRGRPGEHGQPAGPARWAEYDVPGLVPGISHARRTRARARRSGWHPARGPDGSRRC